MRKFAAILGVISATIFGFAEAKLGFGGCPKLTTTAAYNSDMKTLTKARLHYLDRLPNNLFTLANLLVLKKYNTLDCLGFDDTDTIQYIMTNYLNTQADYDNIADKYLGGTEYGFKGGIIDYTPERNEFIVSACLDASGLGTLLAGKLLGDAIPDSAKTAINIATTVFKFLHFQITVVVSDKIDYTAEDLADVLAKVDKVPGMKSGYLTQLLQDVGSCPDGGKFPSFE
jgi:hypothetical protein